MEQFLLRPGDIVNPILRPAGILIPEGAGQRVLTAGFGQIEGQVMKVGMVAEATCISKPWVIIPLVVTNVQNYIAAGQFRGGEQLLEAQNTVRPGTILVFMEPLYKDGLDGVTAGSSCIANAYTSNHELISSGKLSTFKSFCVACRRCNRTCARLAAADPGAAAADQDAGAERALSPIITASAAVDAFLALIDAALGAFENFETTLYFSGVIRVGYGDVATAWQPAARCATAGRQRSDDFRISTAFFITGVQHAIKKWTEAHRDSAGLIRWFANLELCV